MIMKKFIEFSVISLVLAFIFSLLSPAITLAVTPPDLGLGLAASYSVFGKAGVTTTGVTHVWGNVGADSSVGLIPSEVDGSINTGAAVAGVETDARSTYDSLMSATQGVPTGLDLAGTNTITPGVYTIGATTLNGVLTLDGAGTYIFRGDSSNPTNGAGTMNLINGAVACNVFWAIPTSMTIGTGSHIEGTIIAHDGLISIATGATLKGRAISLISQVTLDANQITEPTCAVAPTPTGSRGPQEGTINVVKRVINDNGGTKNIADFPLFVSGVPVVSGTTNTFRAPAGVYIVTETTSSNYTKTFSGDCDVFGHLNLIPGDNKFCIITNNDIGAPIVAPVPPLINVVKVPNPLSLPNGPGLVEYSYTLTNIGTVPATNITMVGDTCSPIILNSGDLNSDAKLDLNETWVYKCSTTLQKTHTNTVVATGWANGIVATDIASAHVVVGLPIVPPLINITKTPNTFSLAAGGGMVTYTKKVTNPGTEPLSNVLLTDDKCNPVNFISGDTNNNTKLDTTETWVYTCRTNLTETITNTASVTGEANGLIARDFAIATVVVAAAVPALPSTGFSSGINGNLWSLIAFSGLSLLIALSLFAVYKKSKV